MQYACPNGWHVPTNEEWNTLEINLGMNPLDTVDSPNTPTGNHEGQWFRACGIPPLLMATTGWNNRGTNVSGFNIIGPNAATFWTSSNWGGTGDLKRVTYWVRQFFADTDYIRKYGFLSFSQFQCRCIED